MSSHKTPLSIGVPPAASRGRQRRAGGAAAPSVHLSASPAAARPASSANFSWSFVMVTWRCCGYITANDRARSALHAELLTVCLSVCLCGVHAAVSHSNWSIHLMQCWVTVWQLTEWSERKVRSYSFQRQLLQGNYDKRGAVISSSIWQLTRWERGTFLIHWFYLSLSV